MSSLLTSFFPPQDQERIAATVKRAEARTSGEVVPYVVETSDQYEEAEWRAALACGVFAGAFLLALNIWASLWMPFTTTEFSLIVLACSALGFVLARYLPAVKRFFAGRLLMDRRVAQRAFEAFVSEEIFQTRDRTGILIFLSLLERKVLVIGDSGINAKVRQEEWNDIVSGIAAGIASGARTDALIHAIERCGQLLERRGVAIKPDDTDELPDSLRMSDR